MLFTVQELARLGPRTSGGLRMGERIFEIGNDTVRKRRIVANMRRLITAHVRRWFGNGDSANGRGDLERRPLLSPSATGGDSWRATAGAVLTVERRPF
jgi:hypothetical protein